MSAASPGGEAIVGAAAPALGWISAAAETESQGGPSNDDMTGAQELSFMPMLPGRPGPDGCWPQQAVLDGTADGAGGGAYDNLLTTYGVIASPNSYQLDFAGAVAPGGEGVLTIKARADLDEPTEYLTLKAEGLDLGNLFVEGGSSEKSVETALVLSRDQLSALAADGVISLTVTPSADVEPLLDDLGQVKSGYVRVGLAYSGGGGGSGDYYCFDLAAGESVSLAVAGETGNELELGLFDAGGELLAGGSTGYADVTAAIPSYTAPEAGTLYVRVAGTGDYRLVVNRNAAMDLEDNDSPASAQLLDGAQLDGRQWAAGRIDGELGSDSDFYAVTADAGSLLKIRAYTAGASALQPVVSIYDSAGRVVASSEDLQTVYHVPRGGDGVYTIEVASADGSTGEYVLSVQNRPFGANGQARGKGVAVWDDPDDDDWFVQPKGSGKLKAPVPRRLGLA